MRARDIMTADPACCEPHDPVTRAATIMADAHCGCVPVVEPGTRRILGVVTDRDLALRVLKNGHDPRVVPVEDVMSRGVVCCLPDDDIEDVEQRMRTHRVRRVPVVDDQSRVVGIIAQADLVTRALYHRAAGIDADDVARTLETISEPSDQERF